MRKGLMAVAVLVCMAFAVERLHSFFLDHYPVAKPGQCVLLSEDQIEVIIMIIDNNNSKGESIVASYSNQRVITFTYSEMRALNAKVIGCPQ